MRHQFLTAISLLLFSAVSAQEKLPYPIVDTNQLKCYDNQEDIIFPKEGKEFYGQDANFAGNQPQYKDSGTGAITDLVTGLMWQKSPGEKKSLKEALAGAKDCKIGNYKDWRVPTIKELYSLIDFSGLDPDPNSRDSSGLKPFINTKYFDFKYGDAAKGERIIDSQYGSSTKYVSTTMKGDATLFGVNFADGRIKGYPLKNPKTRKDNKFYFIYVRSNPDYGENNFKDMRDGTITDEATGLIWMKIDSGKLKAGENKDGKMNWEEALAWADKLEYAGHKDWRLPNVKELQSLVDYKRAPKITRSPSINRIFNLSNIKDAAGNSNFPFYWTGTTHLNTRGANSADYIAFGEALGWMEDRRTGKKNLIDVHGAGSQRSDPKYGDPSKFPYGRGPQGDVIRINNHVICVRGGKADPVTEETRVSPNTENRRNENNEDKQPPESFVDRAIKRFDKDGDGKISKKEFTGNPRHFDHLDKNKDGFVTKEEFKPPKGGRRR